MGDLPRGPFPTFAPTIPCEAEATVTRWLRDGGYDNAIARIAAQDPDLANQ